MIPRVVDISHHNVGPLKGGQINFEAMLDAGIWGVILKASEGSGYGDPTYAARRTLADAAGLKTGSYHFNTGQPVAAQIDKFFLEADPDEDTCMVLDFEQQTVLSEGNMSMQRAVEFLHLGEQKLGRKLAIYSGDRLKENIGALTPLDKAYVLQHRLWLAQYGPKAVLPAGFTSYWLWQYTGDGLGQPPHSIAGVAGMGVDLNSYAGTYDQFAADWP